MVKRRADENKANGSHLAEGFPGSLNNEATALFSLFNEIGIIAQLAGNEFERCLPDGLTNSQFGVLNWFVRVDSAATPGRLARAFQVTAGAMTNTLKKLAGKGLVRVQPDAQSGRRKIVTITPEGKALREQAIEGTRPLLMELAGQFPKARIQKQLKELQKIRQYLDERRYRVS
ncbi:MAG: MarR family transcriptional regulator [Gammaproteobacteria bacterium]|nr:MarR family transcriptional regulator [Pseudomonadales bacterium]MCP5348984.1 MarR family transcriptional regulator [Pseudomonadales bacterium]